MGQMEELRVFVCERLHAITSEILSATEKTISNYEEQISRLKEENDRQRSMLDILLKAKSPLKKAEHATKNTSAVAVSIDVSDPSPNCEAGDTLNHSSDSQHVFTSRTDILKFANCGDCPFCLNSTEATEFHLIKKHFLCAVRFIDNGTEKFVVPCTCKDRIQNRSHWHCPICRKIIYRKTNFEVHLAKQHKCLILQQSQDTVSHLQLQNSEQLQFRDEQTGENNAERSMETDHAHYSACVGPWDEGRPLSHSPTPPPETPLDDGVGGIFQPAGEYQHTTEDKLEEWKNHTAPTLKAQPLKRKKTEKRFLTLNQKKSQLSVRQNPTAPHCCKVCGKTFHYMYTLKTHARVHAGDKIQICGFCGKHLEVTENLVQHLQSHEMKSKCGVCSKQFSNDYSLKRHMRCHRPKALNVIGIKTTQTDKTLQMS